MDIIANDSLFSAIDFISDMIVIAPSSPLVFVNKKIINLVVNMKIKFTSTLFQRYIYYIFLQLIIFAIDILLWSNFRTALYYISMIITYPYVIEYVLRDVYFKSIITKINDTINKVLKHMTISIYCYFFNTISHSIINKNPNIQIHELNNLYEKKSYTHFIDFVKILSISSLIQYLESAGSFYTRLVKILYKYGALIEIKDEYNTVLDPYENIKDPKTKITKIIDNRKWDLFYNPKILQMIVKLYTDSKDVIFAEKLNQKINYLSIITGKIFAFYSISTLLQSPYISIGISSILIYLQNPSKYIYKYYPKFIAVFLWMLSYDIVTVTIICEVSEILYNKVTYYIIRNMYRIVDEYKFTLINNNNHNLSIISNCVIVKIIYELYPYSYPYLFAAMLYTHENKILFSYLCGFGIFSNYDTIHLLLISAMSYLYNIMCSDEQYITGKIKIINSYIKKDVVTSHNDIIKDVLSLDKKNLLINITNLKDSVYIKN